MDTCTHQKTSSMCEEHKIDGCYCPPGWFSLYLALIRNQMFILTLNMYKCFLGTVFDDISMKGCIFKSDCQCKRDRIYNSGEMYKQGQEIWYVKNYSFSKHLWIVEFDVRKLVLTHGCVLYAPFGSCFAL